MTAPGSKKRQIGERLTKINCVDLIQTLYTPLLQSSQHSVWSNCLCEMGKTFRSNMAGLVSYDVTTRQVATQHKFGFDGICSNKCSEWVASIRPWLRHLASYRSADAVTEQDLRTWRQSRYLDSSIRASRPMLFGVIERQATAITALCFTKQPGMGNFDEEHKSAISELLPHIRSMLSIHAHLMDLRIKVAIFDDTLFNSPMGTLLAEDTGRVRYQNQMAKQILASNDELFIDELGFVRASSRKANHRLRYLIKETAGSGGINRSLCQQPAQHLVVERTAKQVPLMCILSPVPQKSLGDEFEADPLVALFIQDPLIRSFTGLENLTDSFKMTKAESRIVELILNGHGLFEVAEELGITQNTARTHMRHIYAKVGTHRQADLVRIFGSFS